MTAERNLYVVDDQAIVRASMISLVQAHGPIDCTEFASGDAFLDHLDELAPGCVVLDLQLDGISGREVLRRLASCSGFRVIVVTGLGDIASAVEAFRWGALDFLQKPFEVRPLLAAIDRAFHLIERGEEPAHLVEAASARIARLGSVEAEVLAGLMSGCTNQQIAGALALDTRTIQIHRARALATLDVPSILGAIRVARLAGWPGALREGIAT